MAKFAVYSGNVLVGYSELESGDAPMGVAFGVFEPLSAYSKIQTECSLNHIDQSHLQLSIQTEAGVAIPCDGVGILDSSAESDPSDIEVNILGIPYPLYEELFPQHVEKYDNQSS